MKNKLSYQLDVLANGTSVIFKSIDGQRKEEVWRSLDKDKTVVEYVRLEQDRVLTELFHLPLVSSEAKPLVEEAKQLAAHILKSVPNNIDRNTALLSLRESVLWSLVAIQAES